MTRLATHGLGALGAALSLLACSDTAPPPAGELDLFAWSEYVPQSVLDGFEGAGTTLEHGRTRDTRC
jgi:spermidine/putrescine-binding protein